MKRLPSIMCAPLILGSILLGLSGCLSKAVQSGGDVQSAQQGAAKGSTEGGVSQNIPDTSFSGQNGSGGLRGLDKNPSEERLGGNTVTAKADPGSASRQMEELRAEQIASAAAGLRDVLFAYDSFAISEEGRQVLARNAEWIKSNSGAHLTVEGHCDERGTSAYNLVLGEKRAKSVRNYLVELGLSPKQLPVVSYGKERPVCTEHTESCYAQNRRGHLVVKAGK